MFSACEIADDNNYIAAVRLVPLKSSYCIPCPPRWTDLNGTVRQPEFAAYVYPSPTAYKKHSLEACTEDPENRYIY